MAVQLRLSDGEAVLAPGEEIDAVLAKIEAAESGRPRAGGTLGALPRGFIELETSKCVLAVNAAAIVSLRRS